LGQLRELLLLELLRWLLRRFWGFIRGTSHHLLFNFLEGEDFWLRLRWSRWL
jgi:hypothetical protein